MKQRWGLDRNNVLRPTLITRQVNVEWLFEISYENKIIYYTEVVGICISRYRNTARLLNMYCTLSFWGTQGIPNWGGERYLFEMFVRLCDTFGNNLRDTRCWLYPSSVSLLPGQICFGSALFCCCLAASLCTHNISICYCLTGLELADLPTDKSGFNINIIGVNEHVIPRRSWGVKWWKKPVYLQKTNYPQMIGPW